MLHSSRALQPYIVDKNIYKCTGVDFVPIYHPLFARFGVSTNGCIISPIPVLGLFHLLASVTRSACTCAKAAVHVFIYTSNLYLVIYANQDPVRFDILPPVHHLHAERGSLQGFFKQVIIIEIITASALVIDTVD